MRRICAGGGGRGGGPRGAGQFCHTRPVLSHTMYVLIKFKTSCGIKLAACDGCEQGVGDVVVGRVEQGVVLAGEEVHPQPYT